MKNLIYSKLHAPYAKSNKTAIAPIDETPTTSMDTKTRCSIYN